MKGSLPVTQCAASAGLSQPAIHKNSRAEVCVSTRAQTVFLTCGRTRRRQEKSTILLQTKTQTPPPRQAAFLQVWQAPGCLCALCCVAAVFWKSGEHRAACFSFFQGREGGAHFIALPSHPCTHHRASSDPEKQPRQERGCEFMTKQNTVPGAFPFSRLFICTLSFQSNQLFLFKKIKS